MMYEPEVLSDTDDDGTMQESLDKLREAVVGHHIDDVWRDDDRLFLVLDNGKRVTVEDTDDCCAYTEIEDVLIHLYKIRHVITGVGTTDGFTRWHIFCDQGDVLELQVGWSCGNPFYYGYGFWITVEDAP